MAAEESQGQSALHLAALEGRTDAVVQLLEQLTQDQLGKADKDERNALHLAAEQGHVDITNLLLNRMSVKQVCAPDKFGHTALHKAVLAGHSQVAESLLSKTPQEHLGASDENAHTALHLATLSGRDDIVPGMVKHMPQEQLGLGNCDKQTALHMAAMSGHADIAQQLLEKMTREQMLLQNKDGRTALILAAKSGHADVVRQILQHITVEDLALQDKYGHTALHKVALDGHADVAQLLLSKMPQPQLGLADEYDHTALHLAVLKGHTVVACQLIERMTAEQLAAKDDQGHTGLHLAAWRGHPDVLRRLAERMPAEQFLECDNSRHTALHLAAQQGYADMVVLLLLHMTPRHLGATKPEEDDEATRRHQSSALAVCQCLELRLPLVKEFAQKLHPTILGWLLVHSLDSPAAMLIPQHLLEHCVASASDHREGEITSWLDIEPLATQLNGQRLLIPSLSFSDLVFRDSELCARVRKGLEEASKLKHGRLDPRELGLHKEGSQPSTVELFLCAPPLFTFDSVLEGFAFTKCHGAFATVPARAMIYRSWKQVRAAHAIEAVLPAFAKIATLAALSRWLWRFDEDEGAEPFPLWLVCLFTGLVLKDGLEEVSQAHGMGLWRWLHVWNIVDSLRIMFFCLGCWAIWQHGEDRVPRTSNIVLLAVMAAVSWLQGLWTLRPYRGIGPHMLPIVFAVKDTFGFFLVLLFSMASVTHAFYILGRRTEPSQLYASIRDVYRLAILGDFDLLELEGLDAELVRRDGADERGPLNPSPSDHYVVVHVWFYLTTLGMFVTLMNLFIGVLGTNYDAYQAQAVQLFTQARARCIVRRRTSFMRLFVTWRCLTGRERFAADTSFLIIAKSCDGQEMRQSLQELSESSAGVLKEQSRRLSASVEQRHATMALHAEKQGAELASVVQKKDDMAAQLRATKEEFQQQREALRKAMWALSERLCGSKGAVSLPRSGSLASTERGDSKESGAIGEGASSAVDPATVEGFRCTCPF